jgi:hypothetical protein
MAGGKIMNNDVKKNDRNRRNALSGTRAVTRNKDAGH